MKKKVLIHSIVFSPDGVSTAYLYNDIATGFKEAGFDVIVLSTTPHYNIVKESLENQRLEKCLLGLYYKSYYKGILVFHVPQKKFKSFLMRAFGFVYWHFLSLILAFFIKNISIVISPSPPLTIGVVSWIISKLKGAKVIYNVQEIYPDLLINKGSLKSSFLISALKKLEKFVYNKSDAVVTIDEVFYNTIVDRFNDKDKLHIIPNFVDTEIYSKERADAIELDPSLFMNSNDLKLMYAGNIGHAQDWDPLIAVAEQMKDLNISFWIIGEGVMKSELAKKVAVKELKNIHLLPYQSRESMAGVNAFADLHFIFMNPDMDGQGFPSKVYTIMSCSKPLLVLSGKNTPIINFLENKDCSYLISTSDFSIKVNQIVHLLSNLIIDKSECVRLGINASSFIKLKYSKEVVIKEYVMLVEKILSKN